MSTSEVIAALARAGAKSVDSTTQKKMGILFYLVTRFDEEILADASRLRYRQPQTRCVVCRSVAAYIFIICIVLRKHTPRKHTPRKHTPDLSAAPRSLLCCLIIFPREFSRHA